MMAYDGMLRDGDAQSAVHGRLSLVEKAMLFDAAVEFAASQRRAAISQLSLREAKMLAAFASAYIAIRDRADGLV